MVRTVVKHFILQIRLKETTTIAAIIVTNPFYSYIYISYKQEPIKMSYIVTLIFVFFKIKIILLLPPFFSL